MGIIAISFVGFSFLFFFFRGWQWLVPSFPVIPVPEARIRAGVD